MKINNIKYFLLIVFLMNGFFLSAQEEVTKVYTTTAKNDKTVLIKWMEPALFSYNPSNVYRRTIGANDWELINLEPIIAKNNLELLEKYPNSKMVLDILEGEDPESLDVFLLINLINDAAIYNPVADYLGIFFEDSTVTLGETYEYKIVNIIGGKEEILGISQPIKSAPYQPDLVVQDVIHEVNPKIDTLVTLGWNGENDDFFGVNVWRTDNETDSSQQLNKHIVFATIKEELPGGQLVYNKFFFSDQTSRLGKEYAFQVEGVNYFGQGSKKSEPIVIKFTDNSPAPLPENFEVDLVRKNEVFIHWTDISKKNLKGINVLIKRANQEFVVANKELIKPKVSSFEYQLPEYGSYAFKIQTINSGGEPSVTYRERLIDYKDVDPPLMPTNIQISADTGKAIISWDANTESDLLGYIVFRGSNEDASIPFQRIVSEPLKDPKYINKLAKRAKNKFNYKICAVDTLYNMSPLTEPISIILPDVTPPETPVLKQSSSTLSSATIEWLPFFEDDFESCEVSRKAKKEDSNWEILATIQDEQQLSYVDNKVESNSDYQYKIRASDDSGNWSEFSNVYNIRTKTDNTPAEGVDKITTNYQKKKKQVTIKWKEGVPNRKGSVVFRKNGNGRMIALSPMIDGKTVFVDKKITQGKTYTYMVKTYYTDGKVGASNPKELVISE